MRISFEATVMFSEALGVVCELDTALDAVLEVPAAGVATNVVSDVAAERRGLGHNGGGVEDQLGCHRFVWERVPPFEGCLGLGWGRGSISGSRCQCRCQQRRGVGNGGLRAWEGGLKACLGVYGSSRQGLS